jgi:hypothetical protein
MPFQLTNPIHADCAPDYLEGLFGYSAEQLPVFVWGHIFTEFFGVGYDPYHEVHKVQFESVLEQIRNPASIVRYFQYIPDPEMSHHDMDAIFRLHPRSFRGLPTFAVVTPPLGYLGGGYQGRSWIFFPPEEIQIGEGTVVIEPYLPDKIQEIKNPDPVLDDRYIAMGYEGASWETDLINKAIADGAIVTDRNNRYDNGISDFSDDEWGEDEDVDEDAWGYGPELDANVWM